MPASPAIYLDSFAGAPLHPIVGEALFSFLREGGGAFANPSSSHAHGRKAKSILDQSRLSILKSLELDTKDYSVIFCASGTEAAHQATRSMWAAGKALGKPDWYLSAGEHSSVRELVRSAGEVGVSPKVIPLTPEGKIDLASVSEEDLVKTSGASLLPASNETGIITSHIPCGLLTSPQRPLLFIDWIAGWGKAESPKTWNYDYLAITGHKLGAPAGAAALVYRKSAPLMPLIPGNAQNGLRAGTESVISAYALGVVADSMSQLHDEQTTRLKKLRDLLEKELKNLPIPLHINGEGTHRLPSVTNFTWKAAGKKLGLVTLFDLEGICVSSGSACSSRMERPSPVLLAMGRNEIDASNSVRVSFSWDSKESDVAEFIAAFRRIIDRVKPTLKGSV